MKVKESFLVRIVTFLFFFCSREQKQKKVFLFRGTIFEQKNVFGNVCSGNKK